MDDLKKFEPLWGNWYATEAIGEGSFGKVYRIERSEFDTTYVSALKHIRVPQNQSEVKSIMADGMDRESLEAYFNGFVKEIIAEFVLMSKLKGNSHIVSYEDHCVIKDGENISWDIFIRMELLTSLNDYIQLNSISKRDIIKLGIDMCKALELCQKHNIIHRDIKPENIFVSENGDFKLGDFGIARQIEKTVAGLSKKGTFTYIAPEVYKGEAYGSTVDIYSLGIVMYRLLNNNRVPFMPPYPLPIRYEDREIALVKRMGGQAFEKPVNADGRLAEIVLKACAYEPKERYSSPLDMRRELEAIFYDISEASVIYPKGDNVEIKSVEYISTDREENNEEERLKEKIYNSETMTMILPLDRLETGEKGSEDSEDKNDNAESEVSLNKENSAEKEKYVETVLEDEGENTKDNKAISEAYENKNKKYKIIIAGCAAFVFVISLVFVGLGVVSTVDGITNSYDDLENKEISNGLEYKTDNGLLTIRGKGAMGNFDMSIPPWASEKIKEVRIEEGVTSIGNRAFYGCTGIESVTMAESVTSIGESAFMGCTNLLTIEIPSGVEKINKYTFCGCDKLYSVDLNKVNTIGESAFFGCDELKNIEIKYVDVIESGAFSFSGLESVELPYGLESIESEVFSACGDLTYVYIPNTVESIGYCAFYDCDNLENIDIPQSVKVIGPSAFSSCTGIKSIVIPNSVTEIGNSAFASCNYLKEITIPDSVISIGEGAFSGCWYLKYVPTGKNVTKIAARTFSDNPHMKDITIPENIKTIEEEAFSWHLNSVKIPASVTNIDKNAFTKCKDLKTVYCKQGSVADNAELYQSGAEIVYY